MLEGLEVEGVEEGVKAESEGVADKYILYPVKLERWLMEGSYDRVWGATKREGVPSEEFGVFSEVSCWFFLFLFALGGLSHLGCVRERSILQNYSQHNERYKKQESLISNSHTYLL